MNRRDGRRWTDIRWLALGLLLPVALALASLPAAGANRALQTDENSYTDPIYGWSIGWDPAIWMNGGELPTAPNDEGVSGVQVAIATDDFMTYGGVLAGSHTAYGDDLEACLADVPSVGESLGFTVADVQEADLDPPATADDAETTLAYATIDAGGTQYNGLIYGECRPLVEGEAVLRVVWVLLDAATYETALPAFEDLLAGIDASGAQPTSESDAADGETYTDPFISWSIAYNPQAWTLDGPMQEFSDSSNGERVLTSSGAGFWGFTYQTHGNVYIFGNTAFGDDTAACLEDLRPTLADGWTDVQEAEFEPPTAPEDAAWGLYMVSSGATQAVSYVACWPLVEGESLLTISWDLGEIDRYEDALPVFNLLLAGLDLSEAHAAGEGERHESGSAGATESFTDPIFGWTIGWDPEQWEADGPIPTIGENDEPGTQMDFLGRDYEGMGYVRIGSVATTSLDPAGCVELFRPKTSDELIGDGAVVENLREPDLPLPAAPADAVGRLFQYAPGDQMTYLECRVLVAGEAVLLIDWYLPEAARYEQALPAFEALIAGLGVGGGDSADGAGDELANEESTDAPADEESVDSIEVVLTEFDGSGVGGVAVTIAMDDGAFTAEQKPYVHAGTCADFNPEPIFSLRAIDKAGRSETRNIAVSFADLVESPHAIVFYPSRTERETVVACGELAG